MLEAHPRHLLLGLHCDSRLSQHQHPRRHLQPHHLAELPGLGIEVANHTRSHVHCGALTRDEIEHRIKTRLGRKIIVVGACTGSDAHTVGIDAILNYKGYAGDKGLESYKGFEAYNLGAQVENDQLMARARALKADAILVSQVITQRNCHKENGQALVDAIKKEGWRDEVILLFGGPRIDHKLALELGFDAGFGPGTKPGDVASFLVEKLCGDERVKGSATAAAVQ